MGDGRVALIVDVAAVVRLTQRDRNMEGRIHELVS
jgi:chemotaxis protein histidine kinase CheA